MPQHLLTYWNTSPKSWERFHFCFRAYKHRSLNIYLVNANKLQIEMSDVQEN